MRKYFLYGLGAVMGLALSACDGYKEPNPPAQFNPQEPVLKASDVTAESKVSSDLYDLASLMENNESIEIAQLSCSVLPEGYELGALAYVSADNFETSVPVASTVTPVGTPDLWNVVIPADSLQAAYNDGISKDTDEITLQVRFLVTTVNQGQVAIVGGLDHFYGPYSLKVLPAEPAVIEMEGPFLWTPGGSNGWSQDASQQLFTTDGGTTFVGFALLQDEFKFTNQNDWNGINYGAGEEEGTLSTDGGAGNILVPVNGLYWCKVNVEDLTYELTLISTIGAIGDFNGWSESVALSTTNNLVWTGNVDFTSGGFKFRCNDDWAVNLGGDAYNYLLPDGPNLNVPGEGVYKVTLDLTRLPYICTFEKQ